MARLQRTRTPMLDLAYETTGPADALPVVLVHGFPYDPRAFDDVVAILEREGLRTVVPYVRGYGGTRFLSPAAMRSGQQAAVGHDLHDLLDALQLDEVILAGFDWGARAACIVAALWPARVRGLVSCGGYQIQDIAAAPVPSDPESERRWWYQYYFHTERGRNGLLRNRHALCKLLWKLWSPTWSFDDVVFDCTATSFENPDFVDVAIHSYRHRHGNAEGDPRYAATEARLATLPDIGVPTIAIHGAVDDVTPLREPDGHARHFTGSYDSRLLEGVGHDVPQECPAEFARAILELRTG
ncbi:MAG: alpha/beta hydrolase [Rhodocyclaceae bacterium]|nr:alpha/beta hydrolase [Rhodocyclaceae bacterium]